MTNKDADVFMDVGVEWRLLNKLLLPQNRDYINRLSPALFTANRSETFRAMQLAFTDYGTISYEGIHKHMQGKVPGELTASNSGDLLSLLDQAIRLAKKRQLRNSAQRLEMLSKEYDPDDNAINAAIDFDPIMAEEDSSLSMGIQGFLGDLHAKRKGDYIFAHTGFNFLNRHMGGEWKPKSLVVMVGGAGSGKTVLIVNSQKHMAKGYPNKRTGELVQNASLFISLEMSKQDLILRMVADELNINNTDLLAGEFDKIALENDYESVDALIDAIERKTAELQQLPMYFIDNGKLSLAQIAYQIRKHVHKYNIRMAAIDYLQLVNHHPSGNDNSDLGEIAEVLKDIAKRENIAIVLLSQVNRSGEGLDAIRDSGEVQAVADVVFQLIPDPDEYANTGMHSGVNIGWWKNRLGPANRKTPILLNGPYQRFEEGNK